MNDKNKFKVYCHTNNVNGKRYVGVTSMSLEKRAGTDGSMYKSSPLFFAAINKYGWGKFSHAIIQDNLSCDQAAKLEAELIEQWRLTDRRFGYNLQVGGFPDDQELFKYQNGDRSKRISKTLKAQRSSPEYRDIMRNRMLEVWKRPGYADLRDKAFRAGKDWGRPHIRVKLVDTGEIFRSRADLANRIGVHKTNRKILSLKKEGDSCQVKTKSGIYTVEVVSKESELLEVPPSKVEDNQQLSLISTDRQYKESSETSSL